jgi:hypothetical protein
MILHVYATLLINQTYIVYPPSRCYSGVMWAICTMCMYLIHNANIRFVSIYVTIEQLLYTLFYILYFKLLKKLWRGGL